MERKFRKLMLIWLIALLAFDMMMVTPVFSGFPPRVYDRPGNGYATFYITPQDSNFTSPPTTNGTWFTVNVRIENATCVAQWQIEVIYNKTLLYTSPANISYAADHIFPAGKYTPVTPTVDVFNTTHNYILHTAISLPYEEYNATDAGLATVKFQIIKLPAKNQTLSSLLYFTVLEMPGIFNSYTLDYDLDENDITLKDGYYEIKRPAAIPAYLELSPTAIDKPTIPGDRIVGKPDAFFEIDMLINNVDPVDFLVLVQFNVTFDDTLLRVDNVVEGTFMNNSAWAPYGTFFFWIEDPGALSGFIMISTNPDTGQWDMTEFPSGNGTLATIRFEAIYQPENRTNYETSDLFLDGIFDEFFLSANDTWIRYGPPISGSYTIYGYDWSSPMADFDWSPEIYPLINETVTFDAGASYGLRNVNGTLVPDPDYIALYTWDFGDGNITTVDTAIIDHIYNATGDFDVTLTVTDNDTKTDSLTKTITVYRMNRLIVTTTLGGTTVPEPGEQLYFPGTDANITAIPDAAYYFDHWELDAEDKGSINPIIVTMDTDHLLHAVFSPMLRLNITSTLHGTTQPAPGLHLYLPGTNVSVTGVPDTGYYLDHWELDGKTIGSANPIVVTMDTDHLLHAVFSPTPPLQVQADVGSLHFPGETAEFYILVSFQGSLVNATAKSFKLYFEGILRAELTGEPIATGLYRIIWGPIPIDARTGTYTLVIQMEYQVMEYQVARGNTLKSFLISPGFGDAGARLIDIQNKIATILIPDVGYIRANLTTINAKLNSIQGSVANITTTLGTITANLDDINATITELIVDSKGEILVKIDTALGPITTKLNTIGTDVTTIKGDTATVKTTLDDVETSLGSVQSTATTTLIITSALSAIAAIVAIIILILLTKKK